MLSANLRLFEAPCLLGRKPPDRLLGALRQPIEGRLQQFCLFSRAERPSRYMLALQKLSNIAAREAILTADAVCRQITTTDNPPNRHNVELEIVCKILSSHKRLQRFHDPLLPIN